ncbi:protein kinase, partial [Actinocrispum sp. NPDC049592]|uniref:serine/threonine-protein kinase n=1 Tax=Actinocrispum sp. NPDC049592 TaxID=3154835 RepID=UPI00344101C2
MDGLVGMAASLLSFAHTVFGPGIWPGEWIWATIAAGFFLAVFPMLASLLVALIRKGTGNAYNATTVTIFAIIGLTFALIIPWVLTIGMSQVYSSVFGGGPSFGLSGAEVTSLQKSDNLLIGPQVAFLGGGPTVYDVLTRPSGGPLYAVDIARLVALPGAAALFVILQARTAMRRGPKWPGRLIWLPFVAFLLFSVGVEANTAFLLWIGLLLGSVLAMIPVLVIGPPTWTAINRSVQEEQQPPPPPQQPLAQHQQQPPPSKQQIPPYRPEPSPPPFRGEPPLLSGQQNSELLAGRQRPAKLADTPGPLPFPLAGGAPPPVKPPMTRQVTGNSMWTRSGGRFQKIKALGHGGFGTVWLAMDTQLDRTVAVKMAHAPDAETEQRMLREARALAAVRHPNCVRVYDIVEDEDGLGIVMEYIEGMALADAVHENGPLDDIAAARLWVTMAGALSAAHAKGVLHRDIKPSNIMIDPSGMPHLIDFGIARAKGDSTLTKTGMMVGTPDFLAPETAAGAPATPASDAWQLAATVSYALTGEPPRGVRENPMAALMAAAKAERISHLPTKSVHYRLISAALGADLAGRPTLDTVIRQTGGWLSKGGHQEDGPITKVVKREDIQALDRTKVVSDPVRMNKPVPDPNRPQTGRPDLDRTQISHQDPERTQVARPDQSRQDPERTQLSRPPGQDPERTQLSRPDQLRQDSGRPDQVQAGRPGQDPERTQFSRPDQLRQDSGRPDQVQAGRPGQDPERTQFSRPD